MTLFIGKVVDVHPEHNAVDVRLSGDGRRLVGVPVTGLAVTGNTGVVDLPIPDLTTARTEPEKWFSHHTNKRDIMAIIGFANDVPFCLGFVCPPMSELNFEGDIAKERRLFRHASDVYAWTDRNGNSQWCHPSGSYVTLAEDPEKLDLTAKDYDKKWKIRRNLARVVHFMFSFWNGSEKKEKFSAHIDPDGFVDVRATRRARIRIGESGEMVTVDLQGDGTVTVQCESDVSVTTSGNVAVNAAGSVVVTATDITMTAVNMDLVGLVKINGVTQVGD